MHSINVYVFGNGPRMRVAQGERVRWYSLTLGTEVDPHTPHWHGNTVVERGHRTDVLELLPASMHTADMLPDDAGTRMFHCRVNDHRRGHDDALRGDAEELNRVDRPRERLVANHSGADSSARRKAREHLARQFLTDLDARLAARTAARGPARGGALYERADLVEPARGHSSFGAHRLHQRLELGREIEVLGAHPSNCTRAGGDEPADSFPQGHAGGVAAFLSLPSAAVVR